MADPHKKSTYVRKYYLANREKWLSRSKAWREAHREEVLAKGREYRKTNGHKIRARANARRVARREEVLAKEMARRNGRREDLRAYLYAYHLKRKYGLTLQQYDDLLHAQKSRCAICGRDKPGHYRRFVVDHSERERRRARPLVRAVQYRAGILQPRASAPLQGGCLLGGQDELRRAHAA
jgi:hypothetical protein